MDGGQLSSAICPAISVEHIRKIALDDVSFSIAEGSVHALLGENGAGKSTVVRLLSGLVLPDHGKVQVFGQDVRLSTPRHAHRHGVQTAFQELTLVDDLTVLDNMLLPYGPIGPLGMINRRRARDLVRSHFETLGMKDIVLDDEVGTLDLAIQQKLEIARAIFRKPKILLLDEPTSTLSGRDVDWLGLVIEQLRQTGVTTVFISHRLREVRAFCDMITVLRNGHHIASGKVSDYQDEEIIRMIAGRSFAHAFPPRRLGDKNFGPEVLGAQNLSTAGKLRDGTFSLRAGEIVGVAGLQGMGQLDLFLACFGMAELTGGELRIDGAPIVLTSPLDAVRSNIGISLVPEDRKTEALFLKLTGKHNASLPVISRFSKGLLIDELAETAAVDEIFQRVEVDIRALWTRVSAFSGGNQQKIAIAKWLLAESRVLLLFDPTRGIDVGTKNELYKLIRTYADAGGAVLFHSTEIPEIVHLTDRAFVFYNGRPAAELTGEELTEEAILRAALGTAHSISSAA